MVRQRPSDEAISRYLVKRSAGWYGKGGSSGHIGVLLAQGGSEGTIVVRRTVFGVYIEAIGYDVRPGRADRRSRSAGEVGPE